MNIVTWIFEGIECNTSKSKSEVKNFVFYLESIGSHSIFVDEM